MGRKVKKTGQPGSESPRPGNALIGKYRGAAVFLLVVAAAAPAFGVDIRMVKWDGATFSGQWVGAKDGKSIEIQTTQGPVSNSIDDLANIELSNEVCAPFGPVAFFLHDGGKLLGEFVGGKSETLDARTILGDVKIGWSELAGVRLAEPTQYKRANELFDEASRTRSPSQDVLISRDRADVKVLQGRLDALNESGGMFNFANEQRKFQNEKLFAVIFAAGAARPETAQALVELADGSSFMGTLTSADTTTVRMATSFGASVEIPLANVRLMKFHSDRVEYLSDMKPATQRTEGILHAPWPIHTDRNVLGDPISMGGRTFERGLGVHSRTELAYPIHGEFDRFAATIGIDDAVRPLGSVVMQILGDGRMLFDSGIVAGNDPPRAILVDVAGVQSLTLLVDYGPGLDASDHADWGDARLLRPQKGKSKRDSGS